LDFPAGASILICAEEKSAARFLNKLKKFFFEILKKAIGAAKTERNREFRPNNKARSILKGLSAQFKVLVEEIPDLFFGYLIPVDIRGDISLEDRSGEGVFIGRVFFHA